LGATSLSAASGLTAETAALLDRRTGNTAVGAKYTAVAFFGFEQDTAGFAIVKPLAGIRGHGLGFPVTTFRTANL
jgi:hypothetical protein